MRSTRAALAVCILLFAVPSCGKRPPQSASTPQPASDPQAVAVVQAAITALGGANAISHAQSWTFQAEMQGPHANGTLDYVISTDTDTGKVMRADRTATAAPPIHSHFVPALVGAILLKESQDAEFSVQYGGQSTQDSKLVTTIVFTAGQPNFTAQIWTFDEANLPVTINFRLPAEIGARESFPLTVALSDYRSVSGVLYPFQIVTFWPGKPSEIVTIHSVNANASAPANEYRGEAGDLQ